MEDIVSLCKRRGFIYQGSEIYGGLAGTWDYGPLGVALKRNIENLWWQTFVESRDDMYGVDAAILMNQKVWQASGHVDTFTDPLVECQQCKARLRADHIEKTNARIAARRKFSEPRQLYDVQDECRPVMMKFYFYLRRRRHRAYLQLQEYRDSFIRFAVRYRTIGKASAMR